jgi:hypothetical protein
MRRAAHRNGLLAALWTGLAGFALGAAAIAGAAPEESPLPERGAPGEHPEAAAERTRLSIERVRISLEFDGAALSVEERHDLAVDGDGALTSSSESPLLLLELPANSESLRLSPASRSLGLSEVSAGALALRGPIPAGSSALTLGYRVPAAGPSASFERRFPRTVSLLSIFVADTGLLTESDRLHRRRPLRTTDRSYLHLEGFEIGPEETVALRLTPLPPRRPRSAAFALGSVLVLAAGAAGFLLAPLRSHVSESPPIALSAPTEEREALYAAIRDLDDDLETGKLERDDHAALRGALRARAVALLREERGAVHREAAESAPSSPACPHCGTLARAGDRFCAQCGAELGSGDRSESSE